MNTDESQLREPTERRQPFKNVQRLLPGAAVVASASPRPPGTLLAPCSARASAFASACECGTFAVSSPAGKRACAVSELHKSAACSVYSFDSERLKEFV